MAQKALKLFQSKTSKMVNLPDKNLLSQSLVQQMEHAMFKVIVVGYDGSDPSVRALEAACELTKVHQSELHLVHTPELSSSQVTFGVDAPVDGRQAMQDAVGIGAAMGVTPASTTIGTGTPCDEIMTIVDLYDGDLIVTGRRGLGGVSGLFMGSTSQKLAQVAKCACMTVA
jgi:nucleotide-binding universal stress UspA family protein